MGIARKLAKAIAWIAMACFALVAVIAVSGYYALEPTCANEVLAEVPSPDGSYKAVVFQRDCGATTGFSTQISILRSGRSLGNNSGNTFSSDTNHGASPSGPGGGPEIRVNWLSPTELSVARHSQARVFLAEPGVGSVSVHYSQFGE